MLPLFVSEAHGHIIQGQAPGTGGLSSMAQGHPITCFAKDQQGWKLEKWEMDRGHRRGRTLATPSLGARDPHPLSPGAQAALGGEVKGGTEGYNAASLSSARITSMPFQLSNVVSPANHLRLCPQPTSGPLRGVWKTLSVCGQRGIRGYYGSRP